MNEISTNYKASPKLSSWINRQLQAAAKYVPRKGGICNLCGSFCRTYKTDSETGTRYHYCVKCGINFKTNTEARKTEPEQEQKKPPVGSLPAKQDARPVKKVKVDSSSKKRKRR
jgi:hypothetical protein